MNLPLRRLAIVIFVVFGLLVASLTYSQVIAGPRYRDDPRNARVVLDRAGRERGGIVTADGVIVAESVADTEDERSFRRSYPFGDLYSHVVGYSSVLFGDRGLENARGGALSSDRDATISGLFDALVGEDLRAKGLRLTIDHSLQQVASDALGDQAGAVVALDPTTGEILAMVSKPSFDPNTLVSPASSDAGDAIANDPTQPLLNRAIEVVYAPGSTFKTVTAAAAVESGGVGPTTEYPNLSELALPGSTATIQNFGGGTCGNGEQVTLETAFARSCNTVFGIVGMETGAGDLVGRAEAVGFNSEIPFDLETEPSTIPDADSLVDDLPALAQTALGQRDVRATPLQMALVAAAVANDGVVTTPYVVNDVIDADGEVVEATTPTEWRRAFSPSTASVLSDMMERVVTSGTGQGAAVPRVRVGGKTGTAEVPGGAPHAWFIGFGPIEAEEGDREIAVAVIVESGGSVGETATGGAVAAPIAQKVLSAWLAGRS